MTRADQTTIILLAMIVLFAIGVMLWMQSQDAEAIRTGDYDACWSSDCERQVAGAAADRL